MSLRQCEKLMAPNTLKRVCAAGSAASAALPGAVAVKLFSISTYPTTSSAVLREWRMTRFAPYVFLRDLASRWDVLAFIVVIGLIAFLGETSRGLFAPLSQLELTPLSLDPIHLPEYAARTTFRMLAGLVLS